MRLRKRAARLAVAGLVALGVGVGFAVAASASPAVQVCDKESPLLCMNRAGGGGTMGTTVTAYDAGDLHGTYEGVTITGRCNAGHVSAAQHCPFNDQSLNQAFDNDRIMYVEEYVDDWCIGTAGQTLFGLRLEACPNIDGQGGGWATQYVWNGAGSVYNCLINVEKTNDFGSASAIYGATAHGRSNQITLDCCRTSGSCTNAAQWKEYFT